MILIFAHNYPYLLFYQKRLQLQFYPLYIYNVKSTILLIQFYLLKYNVNTTKLYLIVWFGVFAMEATVCTKTISLKKKPSLSVSLNHLQTFRKSCSCAPLGESVWKQFFTLTRTSLDMEVKAAWADEFLSTDKNSEKKKQKAAG